jgi:hypothetical protein
MVLFPSLFLTNEIETNVLGRYWVGGIIDDKITVPIHYPVCAGLFFRL